MGALCFLPWALLPLWGYWVSVPTILLGAGYVLLQLLAPAAFAAAGELNIHKRDAHLLSNYDTYPLDEIADAGFWPGYITLQLRDGRTITIWLRPFRQRDRERFEQDLRKFLRNRVWPIRPISA